MKELEQSLLASEEKLKHSEDVAAAQEARIQELVSGSAPPGLALSACAAAASTRSAEVSGPDLPYGRGAGCKQVGIAHGASQDLLAEPGYPRSWSLIPL